MTDDRKTPPEGYTPPSELSWPKRRIMPVAPPKFAPPVGLAQLVDAVRSGAIDMDHNFKAVVQELDGLWRESRDHGSALIRLEGAVGRVEQLLALGGPIERRAGQVVRQQSAHDLSRFKAAVVQEIVSRLDEAGAELTGPQRSIPPARVQEIVEDVIDRRKIKSYEDAATSLRKLRNGIIGTVLAAIILACLAYVWGKIDGRNSLPAAPTTQAPIR